MDKRGLVLNGMRELVRRFPLALRLVEDEEKEYGYRMRVGRGSIVSDYPPDECLEVILFWDNEEAYELTESFF